MHSKNFENLLTYGIEMNDDPLWIVKQEIAERNEYYSNRIGELTARKEELKAEIEALHKKHKDEMDSVGSEVHLQMESRKTKHTETVNTMKAEFAENKSQIENHTFAEQLIIQDQLEQESSVIKREIQELQTEETETQIKTKTETESQLLNLRSIIEESSEKYKALSVELVELTDKKLVANKVDKFRRGPQVTPLDKDIKRAEAAADDARIQFQISAQKMDEQFTRTDELLRFQIKKLKREIANAVQRIEESKLRIADTNENHKIKMASLRMEIIRLSNGPSPKLPSASKVKAIKDQQAILWKSTAAMEEQRNSLNEQYQQILATNRKLKQQVKKKQFNTGYSNTRVGREY